MMQTTYKGITLNKRANQYTLVEVSELVALYMKNHVDEGTAIYVGSVQDALEDMFGEYDWRFWADKVAGITNLIKYIGFRPTAAKGKRAWLIPKDELKGPIVESNIPADKAAEEEKLLEVKETPVVVQTQIQRPVATPTATDVTPGATITATKKGTIPEGLRRNIAERASKTFVCEFCGRTIVQMGRGVHMVEHFGPLGENGTKVVEAVEAYPGLSSKELADVLKWDRAKVTTTLKALKRKRVVEQQAKGMAARYFSMRPDRERAQKRTEAPKVVRPAAERRESRRRARSESVEPSMDATFRKTIVVIETSTGEWLHIKDGHIFKVELKELSV